MNRKRYLLASLAVFIFIFAFEWVFHGVLLEDVYAQTPALWRPKTEMVHYMRWLFFGQLLFAFIFSYIFVLGYENKGIPEGFRYGFWIALLLSAGILVHYAVTPVSAGLVAAWILGTLAEMGLAGAIVAGLYKP